MRNRLLLLPFIAVLALAGCDRPPALAPTSAAANPNPQPPQVPVETIPKPPVSEEPLVWQPGHWDWLGNGYEWRKGEWVQRGGHGTEWQDGYWNNAGGRWEWQPAHWL